jgi:hypothetical protein
MVFVTNQIGKYLLSDHLNPNLTQFNKRGLSISKLRGILGAEQWEGAQVADLKSYVMHSSLGVRSMIIHLFGCLIEELMTHETCCQYKHWNIET